MSTESQSFVYDAYALLTGNNNEYLRNPSIVVENATITWVGPRDEVPERYQHATRKNVSDLTILPGLIEAHGHFGSQRRILPKNALDPAWAALAHAANARTALSVGVTTVRSLGAPHYSDVVLREAIKNELVIGPRVLASGPIITTTGGHAFKYGGEVDSITDIRRKVREGSKHGVDVIKVAATGGFMTPGSALWNPQFTEEELRVLVDEAHRLGKSTAAHAHGAEGIRRALHAGIDTLEHVSFLTEQGIPQFDPNLADEIVEANRPVDVTLGARWPQLYDEGKAFLVPVKELYDHGAKLIVGTDGPIEEYVGALRALEFFGIPREEILVAATSRAAEAIGLAGVTGKIAEGYSADFIGVHGDPRNNLAVLDNVELVVARGKNYTIDVQQSNPSPADPVSAAEPRSLLLPEERERWLRLAELQLTLSSKQILTE